MGCWKISHGTWILGLGLILACSTGCTRKSEREFIPAEDRARSALERALRAWQDGGSSTITDVSPAIQVMDSQWRSGQKLADFEIVSAEPGDGPVWFSVKLTLPDKKTPTVRYVVIGQDPLWVYPEDDYKRTVGM